MKCVMLGAAGRLGRHVGGACVRASNEVVAVERGAASQGPHAVVRWATLHPEDVADHHRLLAHADCVADARNQRYVTIGVDTRP